MFLSLGSSHLPVALIIESHLCLKGWGAGFQGRGWACPHRKDHTDTCFSKSSPLYLKLCTCHKFTWKYPSKCSVNTKFRSGHHQTDGRGLSSKGG